jgi:hypothetical protein
MPMQLIEPTDPEERAAAIRVCRLNLWCDPITGEPMEDREECRRLWKSSVDNIETAKWLWMWNHGKDEWQPRTADY